MNSEAMSREEQLQRLEELRRTLGDDAIVAALQASRAGASTESVARAARTGQRQAEPARANIVAARVVSRHAGGSSLDAVAAVGTQQLAGASGENLDAQAARLKSHASEDFRLFQAEIAPLFSEAALRSQVAAGNLRGGQEEALTALLAEKGPFREASIAFLLAFCGFGKTIFSLLVALIQPERLRPNIFSGQHLQRKVFIICSGGSKSSFEEYAGGWHKRCRGSPSHACRSCPVP